MVTKYGILDQAEKTQNAYCIRNFTSNNFALRDRFHISNSRVCYGIMRASLEVNVHFHTNEST